MTISPSARNIAVLLCIGLTSSACAQTIPTAQPYDFKPVRIVGGGYSPGLIGHPAAPGLLYLRTDIGSAYKWNLGANQWIPLTDYHSPANYNLNGPESIALDPTDPNRLYIAAGMYTGGPKAFLVSGDQGATFAEYPAPFRMGANNNGRAAGERLAVNPFNPSQLFMGTRLNGLWKSEDGAQTWTQVSSFPVASSNDGFGVQWVVFDPQHADTIYAGTYTDNLIYQSTNDGASWSPLPGQPLTWPFSVASGTRAPSANRALVNPDGNLYVTFGDQPGPNTMNYGLVMKFNPADSSWTNITPAFNNADGQSGPRGGFVGLTEDPNQPGVVAVSTFDRWYPVDTIYVTRDGGLSWVDLGHVTSAGGVDGIVQGQFYMDPSVFAIAPWLTFGNTSSPQSPTPTARFGWWISALLLDPTNPEHLMFATGATIYATDNLSAAFAGTPPTWYVQALGVEETAVLALISPTDGAHLLSGVGDIGGFRHDDFGTATQMFTNPVAVTVGSLDWAGQNPAMIARVQNPSRASTSPCNYGALSSDGGTTWSPFGGCALGGNSGNGGSIAIDASGTTLMWTASSGSSVPQYATTAGVGASWTTTTGLPARYVAVADKVSPHVFYAFGGGSFYSSASDNGAAFTKVNTTTLPSGNGAITASFATAGDLWLAVGNSGLYHSTDGGVTWTKLPNVSAANSLAIGAAAPGSAVPSVFLYGTASPLGLQAIYRSDDNGASWLRINDDAHQYGGPTLIQADPRVYGRVYLGMNGRGIISGDISQSFLNSVSSARSVKLKARQRAANKMRAAEP